MGLITGKSVVNVSVRNLRICTIPSSLFSARQPSDLQEGGSKIKFYLIDKAPAPIFSWLNGFHNRVVRGMEMLGGMFIFGRVAATNVAAAEA
jgi:hypothetical protein